MTAKYFFCDIVNSYLLQAKPQTTRMSGALDYWAMGGLIFILCSVLIGRQYEQKMRKARLKIKKKEARKILAIKQYGTLAIVSAAITALLMWVIGYFLF
jgi:hypothetical protein